MILLKECDTQMQTSTFKMKNSIFFCKLFSRLLNEKTGKIEMSMIGDSIYIYYYNMHMHYLRIQWRIELINSNLINLMVK